MATVIARQVEAFRLSVEEISAEEMSEIEGEATGGLQDLLDFGKFVAGQITKTRENRPARPRPEAARKLAEECRETLRIMVDAQRLFDGVRADLPDLVLQGEAEFNDAVVDLRDFIAELEDVVSGAEPPAPATEQERAAFREEFGRMAEASPPPPSWFDEDFTALAGPGGV